MNGATHLSGVLINIYIYNIVIYIVCNAIAQFCYKRDQNKRDQIPTRNRANQRTLLKVEDKREGRESVL